MPKPSLRTRNRKRYLLRLPGGRVKTDFKREKVGVLCCSRCGGILHGGPRLIPSRLGKLSASEKRVGRMFGGQLCSSCLRDLLKASVRNS
jgi:large subunit ribosomal protein L34e